MHENKNTCAVFIHVAKAFDSVSHSAIVAAAKRVGVPNRILRYIERLYKEGTTRLKSGGQMGSAFVVSRGVRQGDPLSPLLFNYVMDFVLSQLDPHLGIALDTDLKANHLAFADDVVLLSESKMALRTLCGQYVSALASVGLKPNPKKSATLWIRAHGKDKRWYCGNEPFISMDNNMVGIARTITWGLNLLNTSCNESQPS
jgi:hypothetical protein